MKKQIEDMFEMQEQSFQKFRTENSLVLGELIAQKRFEDLINIFHKQGFLQGLKAAKEVKDA